MYTRLARSLPLLLLLLASFLGTTEPSAAQSSPISVQPHALYRFRISANDFGYILTSNYQEGVNLGFTYDGTVGSIYPVPAPGYTPDPSAGLYPLHRWTVVEDGWRVYTHHSIYYTSHGSNYTYDGIRGYVFPPAATSHTFASGATATLNRLSMHYSQDFGVWNGLVLAGPQGDSYEAPPSVYPRTTRNTFFYQGLIAAGPTPSVGTRPGSGGFPQGPNYSVQFNPPPPPPPPPTCDPAAEQSCYNSGGQWNSDTCTCLTCNAWEEQSCYSSGGQWDSFSCTCSPQCNPRFQICDISY